MRTLKTTFSRIVAGLALTFSILLAPATAYAAMPNFNYYEGVMVTEGKSGDTIYAQNENDQYYPASTTKLMTAHLLMKYKGDKLQEKVTVGDEVKQFGYESSTADIEPGQKLTYEDLLYAMLLPSGNDAAETIAVNIGRELMGEEGKKAKWEDAVKRFVEEMNKEAKALGMTDTHFNNAHGFEDEKHYSTPADFAKFAKIVFEDKEIAKVASTPTYTIKNLDGTDNKLESTNVYLFQTDNSGAANPYYTTDIDAAKTGMTDTGGRTFVFSSMQDDGKEIFGVLFHSEGNQIFTDAKTIAEETKDNYTLKKWTDEDQIYEKVAADNIHFTDGREIVLKGDGDIYSAVKKDEEDKLSAEIKWNDEYVTIKNDKPRLIKTAPAGTEVAQLVISEDNKEVKSVPLYVQEDLHTKNWEDFILDNLIWILLALLLVYFYLNRRGKKQIAQEEAKRKQAGKRSASSGQPQKKTAPSAKRRAPSSGVKKENPQARKSAPAGQRRTAAPKSASRPGASRSGTAPVRKDVVRRPVSRPAQNQVKKTQTVKKSGTAPRSDQGRYKK